MEQQAEERMLPTVAFLQQALREIKSVVASASRKERRSCSVLKKLQDSKYCVLCLLVVLVLCIFAVFMWILAMLSIFSASQQENVRLEPIESLGRTAQKQTHQESEAESEEETYGSAWKVVENLGSEGPSASEEMHDPSLSANGPDTDEEGVEESTGGGKGGKETSDLPEDELLEEEDKDENPPSVQGNKRHEEAEDIDSHILEQVTKAANMQPKILRVIYLKVQQCQQGGVVHLASYVDMYRHLLKFFHIFGTFSVVQGRMLETRLYSLEGYIHGSDAQHYATLARMIHFEDSTGRISHVSPFSGTTLFTCLQRHLQFMSRCLANVLHLSPDMSLIHAFRAAYQEVLAIHHAWFVENFYVAGMDMLPTKEAAMQGVASIQGGGEQLSPETLVDSIVGVVGVLWRLTEVSEAVLLTTNALDKIPKQVIT